MSPLLRPAEVTRLLHAERRWLEQARARLRRTHVTRAEQRATRPTTQPTTDDGESR